VTLVHSAAQAFEGTPGAIEKKARVVATKEIEKDDVCRVLFHG
jgi:hypothetical protein